MRSKIVLLLTFALVSGCARRERFFEVDGRQVTVGNYSRSEVEALRISLSKVQLPAPEHTFENMLPRPVKETPVEFVDSALDQEKKGRIGGSIVEYWLNRDFVLRVATAYYSKDQPDREEWAVILAKDDRDHFERPIYPGAGVMHIAK